MDIRNALFAAFSTLATDSLRQPAHTYLKYEPPITKVVSYNTSSHGGCKFVIVRHSAELKPLKRVVDVTRAKMSTSSLVNVTRGHVWLAYSGWLPRLDCGSPCPDTRTISGA